MLTQLSPHLYRFTDTCHVYALVSGDAAVLIDFGAGDVLVALAAIGVRRVTDVLMTHHHRDQGQGLARAVAAGARIWVPHQEQDLFAHVDAHWQARTVRNNYNVRQDRFSLLEPVPIAGTLADYESRQFGGYRISVLPTPGHTPGSISLLAEVDGARVAFTGDLIAGPGKVWSLAASQWTYNGGEGLPYTVLACLDLRDRGLDLLLPSHGEPMPDVAAAVDPLAARLNELMWLRKQNPRLLVLRDTPYAPVHLGERALPHLLFNRTSMANGYVLLSESGKALFIDFGYDFLAGHATGDDRASRRPWLYTLPALKRQFGVTHIEAAIPTHYHDDHVAGFNLLREVEGTQVWAPDFFADILERPADYDLPCLWYDPIPVDRRLPTGAPIRWEEYELTLYPLPGHTRYAVAVLLEVDGVRVLAVGDQFEKGGLCLNYVYQNRFDPGDYRRTAELYAALEPQLILHGHADPQPVSEGCVRDLLGRGEALERLHRELLPDGSLPGSSLPHVPDLGAEGCIARLTPYEAETVAGRPVEMTAEVRNPFDEAAEALVQVVTPPGWIVTGAPRLLLDPHETGALRFCVIPSPGSSVRRARVAVDITVNGQRFGQQAEALVDVNCANDVARAARMNINKISG